MTDSLSPRSTSFAENRIDVENQEPSKLAKLSAQKDCLDIGFKVMLSVTIAATLAAIVLAFFCPPAMFALIAIALSSGLITTALFMLEKRTENLLFHAIDLETTNENNFRDII